MSVFVARRTSVSGERNPTISSTNWVFLWILYSAINCPQNKSPDGLTDCHVAAACGALPTMHLSQSGGDGVPCGKLHSDDVMRLERWLDIMF